MQEIAIHSTKTPGWKMELKFCLKPSMILSRKGMLLKSNAIIQSMLINLVNKILSSVIIMLKKKNQLRILAARQNISEVKNQIKHIIIYRHIFLIVPLFEITVVKWQNLKNLFLAKLSLNQANSFNLYSVKESSFFP